jgi:hypothetical protein
VKPSEYVSEPLLHEQILNTLAVFEKNEQGDIWTEEEEPTEDWRKNVQRGAFNVVRKFIRRRM